MEKVVEEGNTRRDGFKDKEKGESSTEEICWFRGGRKCRKVESGLPLLRDVAGQHAPSPAARQGSPLLSASFCTGGNFWLASWLTGT